MYKPGRGLRPLTEAAGTACRINMQLLKDHYSVLNSSLLEAGAREVRIWGRPLLLLELITFH